MNGVCALNKDNSTCGDYMLLCCFPFLSAVLLFAICVYKTVQTSLSRDKAASREKTCLNFPRDWIACLKTKLLKEFEFSSCL